METNPTATPPQYNPPGPAPKKGMGLGAKIGIGCGGLVVLIVIGFIIAGVILGPKLKDMAANPTRATATMMVSVSGGKMELSAEDDVNKRYTVKDTRTGTFTTIYWDEKTKAPKVIPGDFSAIPAAPSAPSEPETPAK